MNIPYTLTNDSVTVVIDGKVTTVAAGAVNYNAIRDAIITDDLELIPHLLTPKAALGQYLEGTDFYFGPSFEVMYKGPNGQGEKLPEQFERRIRATAEKGESPKGLLNFFSRLQNNPSSRSVLQLWPFLDHEGIPIEESGHFLAYKAVREDLLDCHSGTIDNTPGNVIRIPRNKISDDPNHACHFGLHVGAVGYAHSFGARILIVRVDPANVVCIPFDSSFQKMRVCEYEVVGFHTADGAEGNANPMPSTTYEVDVDDIDDDGDDADDWDEDDDMSATDREVADVDSDLKNESDDAHDEDGKAPTQEEITTVVEAAKKFAGWGNMTARTLLEQSIADLRTYASKKLKIVGASKVAGGKVALVKRILKVRK